MVPGLGIDPPIEQDKAEAELVIAHVLDADTLIVPFAAAAQVKLTKIAGVPCPEAILAPVPTVQVQVFAPFTGDVK